MTLAALDPNNAAAGAGFIAEEPRIAAVDIDVTFVKNALRDEKFLLIMFRSDDVDTLLLLLIPNPSLLLINVDRIR